MAKVRRPFHESIVGAVRHAYNIGEMESLSNFIKGTKIPKGHDEIIAAWNQRARDLGLPSDAFGVVSDILEQKEEAGAEAETKEQVQSASA